MRRFHVAFPWVALLTLFLLPACHAAPAPHTVVWDEVPPPGQRARLVDDARDLFHARSFRVGDRSFPYDCSGYVASVFLRNGIDVYRGTTELQIRGNGVQLLHQYLGRYGTLYTEGDPKLGDLVFFSNTYDRNRDGKRNDEMTHVGIVESVDGDGTVTFLHNLRGQITRYSMNLNHPNAYKDENGKMINSYLRRSRGRSRGSVLSGELFSGFGSIVKDCAGTPSEWCPKVTRPDSSSDPRSSPALPSSSGSPDGSKSPGRSVSRSDSSSGGSSHPGP